MQWLRGLFGKKPDATKYRKLAVDDDDEEEGGDTIIKGGKKRAAVPLSRVVKFTVPLCVNSTRQKVYIAVSLFCLIVGRVINAARPFALKSAIDAFDHGELPTFEIIAYVVMTVLKSLFDSLRSTVFFQASLVATKAAVMRLFRHLHALSLDFHLKRQTGSVMKTLDRGSDAVASLMSYVVFDMLSTFIDLGLALVILFQQFDGFIVLIMLAMLILYGLMTYFVSNWRQDMRKKMNDKQNEADSRAIESILNFETVKAFTAEKFEIRRYAHAVDQYNLQQTISNASQQLLGFLQQLLLGAGTLAALMLVARRVASGELTAGDFVMLQGFIGQISTPLTSLGSTWRWIRRSLTDVEALISLLDEKVTIVEAPDARPLRCDAGSIKFKDVCFSYEPTRPLLANICFEVPPGKSVAIVGHTGSGKSTIARLLLRFYDVSSGQIMIDDQDIASCTIESVRSCIGLVPQDVTLFNDTILYNLKYGSFNATDEETFEAARAAQLHDFVMALPKGYNTLCGERGLRLSGGEIQRVCVARALIKRPKILLLDEATSSLDTRTEQEIQAALENAARGRTSVTIAHRLSTIVHCDEIIVLGAGKIIERGNHRSLLSKQGVFYEMWHQQLKDASTSLTSSTASLTSSREQKTRAAMGKADDDGDRRHED